MARLMVEINLSRDPSRHEAARLLAHAANEYAQAGKDAGFLDDLDGRRCGAWWVEEDD